MKESIENYLENILILSNDDKPVRSVDLANKMGVTRPSVFNALSILKEGGYIEQEAYSDIVLTTIGKAKAKEIYAKHIALTEFLMYTLGVPVDIAENDACKIEHDLSEETTKRLLEFIKKIDSKK